MVRLYLRKIDEERLIFPLSSEFDFEPNRFLRSVFGHLLAATSMTDISTLKSESALDNALRDYVLDPTAALPDDIHLYYWFYPYEEITIIKHGVCTFWGASADVVYGHVFKFFPFGFWILYKPLKMFENDVGIRRLLDSGSNSLNQSEKLALNFKLVNSKGFPEDIQNGIWVGNKIDVIRAQP